MLFRILIKLTACNREFVRCGSNAAYALSEAEIEFFEEDFENIYLSDTDLSYCSFVKANLSNSKFTNINLAGCDFQDANLTSVRWLDVKSNDLAKIAGYQSSIYSICYSPNG